MATVKFKAHKHHKKTDGTINVKLVVYHKGNRVYPDTDHYVKENQLNKKFEFKDQDLIAKLTKELGVYRGIISALGRDQLNLMSAADLGLLLLPVKTISEDNERIDFIAFGKERVSYLKANGKNSSAGTMQAVVNNFIDFMNTDVVYINDITSALLLSYEAYLRDPHTQKRLNQFKKEVIIERKGMGDAGVFAHMKDFRILFNAARDRYNDMDLGVIRIKNYPFAKYKLVQPPDPIKRSIEIEHVKMIRDCEGLAPDGRAEMARAVFLLSFYLCGMNAVDIYDLNEVKDGRVSYNRSKTKNKRVDRSFISVKIIPEVEPLLNKWLGTFSKRYSTASVFRKAIAIGLKHIACKIQKDANLVLRENGLPENVPLIKFDFYSARHTVGNEAHNTLGFSEAEVGEVLNHHKPTVTASYIRKMWTLVDRIQEGVVDLLRNA